MVRVGLSCAEMNRGLAFGGIWNHFLDFLEPLSVTCEETMYGIYNMYLGGAYQVVKDAFV